MAGERSGRLSALAPRWDRPVRPAGHHNHDMLLREIPNTEDQAGNRGRPHSQETHSLLRQRIGQDQRQGNGRIGSEER